MLFRSEPNEAEEVASHIYGHILGFALHETGIFQSLQERVFFAGYRGGAGVFHALIQSYFIAYVRESPLDGWEKARKMAKHASEFAHDVIIPELWKQEPVLPLATITSYMHAVTHALGIVLEGSGITQKTPAAQYNGCALFEDDQLLYHYCVVTVYHTYAHGNPMHMYDWDIPGFEIAPSNCAGLSYSPGVCFQQRAFMVGLTHSTTPEEMLTICLKINSTEEKLGCLLGMGWVHPTLPKPQKIRMVQACFERLQGLETEACVRGIGGASSNVLLITFNSPCPLFPDGYYRQVCEQSRALCIDYIAYDCVYLLQEMVVRNVSLVDLDPSWLRKV